VVGVGVRVNITVLGLGFRFALGWFFLRYKNGNLIF
jgi:hypothetical protein